MNPVAWFNALGAGIKLAITFAVLAVVVMVLLWFKGLLSAADTVAAIKKTDKVLTTAAKKSDAVAAKADAKAVASDAAIAKQIDTLKDSKDEALRAELARPLPAEWVRLANCALRGAERESNCEPDKVR
ncbi:MAG TPA: hypothetical protein PLF40_30010 [Kofleriaceae bacterium]|nr:hypothetical protein [Kofleriaceae bacterium]